MEQVTVDVHLDGGAKVETRNPKKRKPKPESRRTKSETLLPKPETGIPKSEIMIPKIENRDPKLLIPRSERMVAYFLALSQSISNRRFVPAWFSYLKKGTA